MQAKPQFVAELLRSSAPGYATAAAEHFLTHQEEPAEAGSSFRTWREILTGRLHDLALSLEEGRPDHLCRQVAWTRVALESRNRSTDSLRASLSSIRTVLGQEMPPAAHAVADPYLGRALTELDEGATPSQTILDVTHPTGRLASEYVLAILEGDRRQAMQLLHDAVGQQRLTAQQAVLEVCLPAQAEIGRMWHIDEISIAEEHFVTATTRTVLAQLAPLMPRQAPNGKSVLICSVASDLHDISIQALSSLLEAEGMRAVFLGADVPELEIAQAIRAYRVDLACLSATLYSQRMRLARSIAAIRAQDDAFRHIPILIGGGAVSLDDGAAEELGADAVARDLPQAVQIARRLVGLSG